MDPPRAARPRLQLSHLLLWTTATAVVAALRSAWTDWDSFEPHTRPVVRIGHVPVAMLYGAALAALCVFCSPGFRRRTPFPREPGHWLLLFLAAAMAIDAVVSAWETWQQTGAADPWWWNLRRLAMYAAATPACLLLAAGARRWRGWLALFLFPLLWLVPLAGFHAHALLFHDGYLSAAGWRWQQWLQVVGAALSAGLTLACAMLDTRRGARRDWLHWGGVACYGLGNLLFAADRFYWLRELG